MLGGAQTRSESHGGMVGFYRIGLRALNEPEPTPVEKKDLASIPKVLKKSLHTFTVKKAFATLEKYFVL